jgi:Flp pilus assembly protein TadG
MNGNHSSERGNSILEFALVASFFLVPMLAGSYSIGMSLVKSLEVGQVCRDANIMVVRGVDLSQSDNQAIVVSTASGLGMNIAGTNNPNPSGLGEVILTTVHLVSSNDCAALSLATGACPNYNQYVFTRRIYIGNSTLTTSVTGNPADTPAANGTLTPTQYVKNTGDQATGFPALVALTSGTDAYISEAAFNISAINVFSIQQMGIIYARNIS